MQIGKVIHIVALSLVMFGIVGGLPPSHGLVQADLNQQVVESEESISTLAIAPAPQSCTWGSLLSTSNCDQKWSKYKEGYRECVEKAAKFFWREYACSSEALEKLQNSCRSCEKQFQK